MSFLALVIQSLRLFNHFWALSNAENQCKVYQNKLTPNTEIPTRELLLAELLTAD